MQKPGKNASLSHVCDLRQGHSVLGDSPGRTRLDERRWLMPSYDSSEKVTLSEPHNMHSCPLPRASTHLGHIPGVASTLVWRSKAQLPIKTSAKPRLLSVLFILVNVQHELGPGMEDAAVEEEKTQQSGCPHCLILAGHVWFVTPQLYVRALTFKALDQPGPFPSDAGPPAAHAPAESTRHSPGVSVALTLPTGVVVETQMWSGG